MRMLRIMKDHHLTALLLTAALVTVSIPLDAAAQVIINEVDTRTPDWVDEPDMYEFIELYDGGTGGSDLTGLVLVTYNSVASVRNSWDLDGYSTDADGYFLLGRRFVVDIDYEAVSPFGYLDDNQGAVALYTGDAVDFPQWGALTTAGLIDAVALSNNAELMTLLNPGQSDLDEKSGGDWLAHSLQRIPNGSGGARNTSSYTAMVPTPGFVNGPYTPVVRDVCPAGCTYSSITTAVEASYHGDEIVVGDGTYYENVDFGGRGITVRSMNGPEHTMIDGGGLGSVVMFNTGERSDSILEGFTLTNGSGFDVEGTGDTAGGGIYAATSYPVVKTCFITGNSVTDRGGGIQADAASPVIYDTVISGNSAGGDGGGAGVTSDCSPSCGSPTFVNCVISGNAAADGGGISVERDSDATIVNSTISGNSATGYGGGIDCNYLCIFFMVNSIVAGNEGSTSNEIYTSSNSSNYTAYSTIPGGNPSLPGHPWPGFGNIDADPLFVDPRPAAEAPTILGSYGLLPKSPSLDSGTGYLVNFPEIPDRDFHGRMRPQGDGPDMGAYEHVFRGDWDADGGPDLLWRNYNSGANYLWYMAGPALAGGASVPMVGDTDWTVGATADFDIDGKPDILWRNTATGANYLWYMDGTAMDSGVPVAPVGTDWELAGAADVNLDDKPDLLWRNLSDGRNFIWYMDGALPVSSESIPTADPAWSVASLDDFNSDGRPDLLWRHGGSGTNLLWYLDGAAVTGTAALPSVGTAWSPDTTADFNDDGDTDICWRNYTTGETYLWYMNGASFTGGEFLPQLSDTDWRIEQ